MEGETAKPERVNDRKITADGKEGPGDRSGEAYPCIPASPAKMEACRKKRVQLQLIKWGVRSPKQDLLYK
ncbi:hypothetical protein BHF15_24330 [Escherichia coli]|nr:hypothetical protein BHF15_24330 [Escherichia coli]